MEIFTNSTEFSPARTFSCGQCFRWRALPDGSFEGIAHGRRITVSENGGVVRFGGFPEREERLWRDYFDLDTDYAEYIARLSSDETLAAACRASAGIHILRQDPFETLISFIISQNNNIPRITGIVERLCGLFGEEVEPFVQSDEAPERRAIPAEKQLCNAVSSVGAVAENGGSTAHVAPVMVNALVHNAENGGSTAHGTPVMVNALVHNAENGGSAALETSADGGEIVQIAEAAERRAFPTAKRLDGVEEGDLAPLRAGFRARYIADAVRRVNSGEIDFAEIDALPLDKARERLKTIVGVGDKVADCVLLFAFRKLDAFPKDVWVKRIMAQYYPHGLPDCTKGIEGIAQQYLFDYIRNVHN